MSKDFWERIDRLEELARKATQGKWNYCGCEIWANETGCSHDVIGKVEKFEDAQYIDAVDPAMILEMIAELKKLAKKLNDQKVHIGRQAERIKVLEEDKERLREAYRKEKRRLIVEFHASEESGADLEQLKRIVNLQTEIKACQQSLGGFCSGHDREYWLEAARKATEEK